ncbi:MAG: hypothetical protein QME12_00020 [Nanoarchaeota archaeon]|nr:hypothetical protein [Nanoarchaeota archaeon]
MSTVIISNMNSWKNIRNRFRIRGFKRIVGDDGEVLATKSVEHLEAVVGDLYKRYHPKNVILDTGDGGVCRFVGFLKKYWPEAEGYPDIGLLRGGRFNVLARQCRVRKKKVRDYIMRIISREGIDKQPIDFLKVEDNNGIESYCFSFGTGAVVTLLEEVYKRKRLGWAGVAFVMGRLYSSMIHDGGYYRMFNQKTEMKVAADVSGAEQHYEGNYLALMAQTIRSIGIPWSETFYRVQDGNKSAGQFHARGVTSELEELMKIPTLARIYFGWPLEGENLDTLASSLHISSEKPVRYQVNGELSYRTKRRTLLYEANTFDIEHGVTLQFLKEAI